jgi:hypothetical protein
VQQETSTFDDNEEVEVMYNSSRRQQNDDRIKVAWKRVHGDVFRKPKNYLCFTVLVGTGIQVSFMALTMLICSAFTD